MQDRFLVTGGAGYVGSHLVALLVERGADVVVLDDLRQGHRAAVPRGARLIEGDVSDVATLDAAEKRRLAAMFVRLSLHPPVRRTARHRRWHRGDLDASRTLRNSLRHLGEPGEIAWRRRGTRPRRVAHSA